MLLKEYYDDDLTQGYHSIPMPSLNQLPDHMLECSLGAKTK